VLSVPGVRWVVLMEGINDIGHSTSAGLPERDVTADQIIAGMKQIVVRVHEHGAKIYGATLTGGVKVTAAKSTCSAAPVLREAIYAARARHSVKAAERLCL
jgi:lysophospholipase L1-like esterase